MLVEFSSVEEAKFAFDEAFAVVKNEFSDARLKEKSYNETSFALLVFKHILIIPSYKDVKIFFLSEKNEKKKFLTEILTEK